MLPFIPSIELMSYEEWTRLTVEHAGAYSHISYLLQRVLKNSTLEARIRYLDDLKASLQEQDQTDAAIAKLLNQATALHKALTEYKNKFNNDKPVLLEMGKEYFNEQGVTYLTEIEREKYRVIPYGRYLYQLKSVNGGLSLDAYDSDSDKNISRFYCQGEKKIFVETPQHDLFLGSSIQFKHSSFNGDKPVIMAGEMQVKHGQITTITSKSGHYRPPKANFLTMLLRFIEQKLFAKTPRIYDAQTQESITFITLTENEVSRPKKIGRAQFFSGVDRGDNKLVKAAEEEQERRLITRCQLGVGYLR